LGVIWISIYEIKTEKCIARPYDCNNDSNSLLGDLPSGVRMQLKNGADVWTFRVLYSLLLLLVLLLIYQFIC